MPSQKNVKIDIISSEKKDFDEKFYRNTLGLFVTGISIVTAVDEKKNPIGMTVNSFASVSLNPALVLWSIDKAQPSFNTFLNAKGYAVNILNKNQLDLCSNFSKPSDDKFKDIEWYYSKNGFPLISNSLAWFDCLSWAQYPGGDHEILVGKVTSYDQNKNDPLTYWNGSTPSKSPTSEERCALALAVTSGVLGTQL